MHNFIKVFKKFQEIGPVSLLFFSEFEPRQRLGQSQMTFDNILGYMLSISMCRQSFITIVHSIQPFLLFQKRHFAISWAKFGNPSFEIMSIVMGVQNFIIIHQKVQGIGPVSLFSEFEPRQNLDLSQISFDNLIGYILSISMCMQNFIIIFHSVQEIGPFSLFQNLELAKASTDEKCHFTISWAKYCQYQCLRKSLSKYSTHFKR